MTLRMAVAYQEWPYRETFAFARETREVVPLFAVHITDGTHIGRGECGIQSLKHETPSSVAEQLADMKQRIREIGSREALNRLVAACSARNAVDCALWDLACKQQSVSVWRMADVAFVDKLEVDITIGLASAEKMQANAVAAVTRGYRLIKIKADADSVLKRVRLIADAAPAARFIVDANEAWSLPQLRDLAPALKDLNVALIEQPLHHEADAVLADYDSPIPLCADESCTTSADLDVLETRYDAVNIKLDKTGGLTEALVLAREAKRRGMGVMVGCNGATSLGNAPAYVIGTLAGWRDLDSQELLYEDRVHGMRTATGELHVFESRLWG